MFKLRALASRLGMGDHRGQGYSQPLRLASLEPPAASPDNIPRPRDHDGAASYVTPEHQEDQRDGLQQTSNAGPSDAASHAPLDSNHAAAAQGSQQVPHLPPSPSPAPRSTSTGAESLLPESEDTKNTPRPPVLQSLGLWTCVVLIGGTALTLGILGFLAFLWKGGYRQNGGEEANTVWRKIMLNDDERWSPLQIVTICSVVLRIVLGMQAAVCTSLVAALLLERRQLPLSKAALVSVTRGISQPPVNLIYKTLSWKTLFQSLVWVEMALLLTIALVNFGIQFTPNILIRDFGNTTLVQFPQLQRNHKVFLSDETAYQVLGRTNSVSKFIPSYTTFGEPKENSDIPNPNSHGVSDTGKKLRSFLPFQEQDQRLRLRSYEGPVLSQELQVMCMRPDITDAQISWDPTRDANVIYAQDGASMSGTISYEKTYEEAALVGNWTKCHRFEIVGGSRTDCLPETFNCTLPFKSENSPGRLPVMSLCHLGLERGNSSELLEDMTFLYNASETLWSASASSWIFLTFSTNLTRKAVEIEGLTGISSIPLNTTLADVGEWRAYESLPNTTLSTSLCFAGLNVRRHNVTLSTTQDPKEPGARWNLVNDEDSMEPIQRFMGTTTTGTNLTLADRGILSMSDPKESYDVIGNPSSNVLMRSAGGVATSTSSTDDRRGTRFMCNLCDSSSAVPADVAALFARTIHTTGRAAWAIQNLLTTYTQSWYAQILPLFDVPADVRVKFSIPVYIPTRPKGLVAVLIMVLVDLICVWIITVLYILYTRYSRQGNVWHTVSQFISEDTRLVLEKSNQVVDEEVENGLKGDDYLVCIGKPKGSEHVSVLRV